MRCPMCKGEVSKKSEVEDTGDVIITQCKSSSCGHILKKERIVEDLEGNETTIPARVEPPDQFEFPSKEGGEFQPPEERLPTAQEMMQKAIRHREETIGRRVKEILKEMLGAASEHLLEGEMEYLIADEDEVKPEVFKQVVTDLRDMGYKVTRRPEPGKGVWLTIKWPTQKPKKKKPTKRKPPARPSKTNKVNKLDQVEFEFKKK